MDGFGLPPLTLRKNFPTSTKPSRTAAYALGLWGVSRTDHAVAGCPLIPFFFG